MSGEAWTCSWGRPLRPTALGHNSLSATVWAPAWPRQRLIAGGRWVQSGAHFDVVAWPRLESIDPADVRAAPVADVQGLAFNRIVGGGRGAAAVGVPGRARSARAAGGAFHSAGTAAPARGGVRRDLPKDSFLGACSRSCRRPAATRPACGRAHELFDRKTYGPRRAGCGSRLRPLWGREWTLNRREVNGRIPVGLFAA